VNSQKLIVNSIEVTDITGKTLKSFTISQIYDYSNYEIDLSGFESGIYFVIILTDTEIFTSKIIKE
jgi:hypothetical protein